MEPTAEALDCTACQTIDRADGVQDGKLYPVMAARVKSERRIFRALETVQERIADAITDFAGSMNFVYLHTGWFAVWIAVNLGALGAAVIFDQYPFGLLTMVVSLEAIFLSTFVMISQNRQASRADVRSEIDFENNLRSEIWSVHIGTQLGIDPEHIERMVAAAMAGYRREAGALSPR